MGPGLRQVVVVIVVHLSVYSHRQHISFGVFLCDLCVLGQCVFEQRSPTNSSVQTYCTSIEFHDSA